MNDYHGILEELDKMEEASRVKDRERRRRAAERERKRRRKQRVTLSLAFLCVLLASWMGVRLRDGGKLNAALSLIRSTPEALSDAAPLSHAVIDAPFSDEDDVTQSGKVILVGDASEAYVTETPENLLPEEAAQTGGIVAENPENLLPEEAARQAREAVNPEALLPETTDYRLESPENLLPGQESMVLTRPSNASGTFTPYRNGKTITLGESAEIGSQYAVLMDADTGLIYAERDSDVKVSPASMTKVLTLLVAVEKLIKVDANGTVTGMAGKVTVTKTVTNYCYTHGCSIAGFAVWETVTVRDLLYGCILPSGADACLALARHISGSQEAFVELMNQKLQQLGISKTAHFTNCIGLYDPDHYCTMRDMAVIMRAAMDNSICRVILNARTFRTSSTNEHPKGISLSNLFLRRIEDRFDGTALDIRGGKTGYVRQSGNCAVSYAVREDGKRFLCVTGKAAGQWRVIYDHTNLYRAYCLN